MGVNSGLVVSCMLMLVTIVLSDLELSCKLNSSFL